LAFPTLDALREGFEVYPVIDAVCGTSRDGLSSGAVASMIDRPAGAGARRSTESNVTST
jgi:hypothetical protein